jgi:hypothetical protein
VAENDHLPSLGQWGSNIPLNPGIWRWAFKQEILNGLKFVPFRMGEDQCFLFDVRPLNKKIYIHDKSVYVYIINRDGQLTRNKKAINEIPSSLKYLFSQVKQQNGLLNYFETVIILRQSLTAIKKGNRPTKLYGLFSFFRIVNANIMQRNTALIPVLRSFFLFSFLKKRCSPQGKNVIMMGGLGNQLFQLNAGLNVSQGKRLVLNYSFVDLMNSSETDLSQFSMPQNVQMFFDTRSNLAVRKIVNLSIRISSVFDDMKTTKPLGKIILNSLEMALGWFHPGRWIINRGVGYDRHIFQVEHQNYIGYFQSYQEINPYLENEIRLISPSSAFQSHLTELNDLKSLVVHVRLGDYTQEKKFGTPDYSFFANSIEEMWQTGDHLRICLYSNEIDVAKNYVPNHLQRHLWIPDQDLISDAETFELMRYGNGYVISNSSFSWWAARLSYESKSRVICPEPWFKSKTEPRMLIPPHWERRGY